MDDSDLDGDIETSETSGPAFVAKVPGYFVFSPWYCAFRTPSTCTYYGTVPIQATIRRLSTAPLQSAAHRPEPPPRLDQALVPQRLGFTKVINNKRSRAVTWSKASNGRSRCPESPSPVLTTSHPPHSPYQCLRAILNQPLSCSLLMEDSRLDCDKPPSDVDMTSQNDPESPPPRPDKLPIETSAGTIPVQEMTERHHARLQEPGGRRREQGAVPDGRPDVMITGQNPIPRSRPHPKYASFTPASQVPDGSRQETSKPR